MTEYHSVAYNSSAWAQLSTIRQYINDSVIAGLSPIEHYDELISISSDNNLTYLKECYIQDENYLLGVRSNSVPKPDRNLEDISPMPWRELSDLRILYIPRPTDAGQPVDNNVYYYGNYIYYGLDKMLGLLRVRELACREQEYGGHGGRGGKYNAVNNPVDITQAIQLVKNKEIDIIIHCINGNENPCLEYTPVFEEAGNNNIKIGIIDGADTFSCDEYYINAEWVSVYFKREMLCGVTYPPKVQQLGLCFYDEDIENNIKPMQDREHDLIWLGMPWIDRRLYINFVQKILNKDILYSDIWGKEYLDFFNNTRCSLNLQGYGYGNIRFYESTSRGAVNISLYPPIMERNIFTEDETIYFNTLSELESIIKSGILEDIPTLQTMSDRAVDKLLTKHTALYRTREVLSILLRS